VKAAVGGQSHPIAGPAVGRRDRTDKSDHAFGPGGSVVQRLVSGIEPGQRFQLAQSSFDPSLGIFIGDETSSGYLGALSAAEWHQFDEANMPVVVARQECQLADLIVVQSARDDAIEFDWREPGSHGGIDPRSNRAGLSATHDLRHGVFAQAVDVDIHAVQPGVAQGLGQWRQQDPVGRHGDIANAVDPSAAFDDFDQITSQGWLAPRKADPAESNGRRGLDHSLDLTGVEQVLVGSVRDLSHGHAVDAAKVAMIGQRNPEIIDVPVEAIDRHGYSHANGAGGRFPAEESEIRTNFDAKGGFSGGSIEQFERYLFEGRPVGGFRQGIEAIECGLNPLTGHLAHPVQDP
jgi:hypothetical protein